MITAEQLIKIEGRAKRAAAPPKTPARDSVLDADASFRAHAREDVLALVETVRRWKRALEGLTPSGSEFVDEPERCAEYVVLRIDGYRRRQKAG